MAARLILVPPGSELLRDSSTELLHKYANGELLIRTKAVATEAGRGEETAVQQGVRLPEISDETLQKARDLFTPVAVESARGKSTRKKAGASADAKVVLESTVPVLAFVEFIGPVDSDWLESIKNHGLELLRYQPENSYLCRALPAAFQGAAQEKFVLGITPLNDELKRQPLMPESGTERVWIVAYGTSETAPNLARELGALSGVEIDATQSVEQVNFYVRIPAVVSAEGQSALLQQPNVVAIENFARAVAEDEVADLILASQLDAAGKPTGSYLNWLEDHAVNGKGVTIGIVDGGIEASHPAFKGRIRDLAGGAKSWHGTFVAGHAAGCYLDEKDSRKFIYGLGVAPGAELLAQDKSDVTTTPAKVCRQTVSEAGPSGVAGTLQNNSWGAGVRNPMDYGSLEAAYDSLVRNSAAEGATAKPLTICFSSGNSGAAGLTRPKAAKNILVTGNSENYRPEVGGADSDNINEVYSGAHASSHGNCGDGRIRPHVVAPGEWTASANYDSHPGQREYVSSKITWGGGSSGASPKTVGVCALLTQWWKKKNSGKAPSPALLRALVVNGAVEMNVGGPIPNKFQGWGRLNVANILAKNAVRIYEDQATLFTQRGQNKQWRIRVADLTKPVKITLAWTDPPGPIGSGTDTVSAVVNKLALRVETGGKLYRGNHFRNGWAEPDAAPKKEGWDNLQNVYLPPGVATGLLTVNVFVLELTTNCLTGKPENPKQDFALVITNGKLDNASTPSDVAVIVDSTLPGQVSPKRETPDAADFDWWANINHPANIDRDTIPKVIYGDSPFADDWWKDDFDWLKSENQVLESETTSANNAGISTALVDGLDLVQALTGNPSESAGESSERSDVTATVSEILTQPFEVALAGLVANWQIAHESDSEIARKRSAVIIVSADTRIGQHEIEALRSISFLWRLYLVSDHAPTLAYLAQSINHHTGIEYRLAANPDDLTQLIVETLVEAGGALRISLDSSVADDGEVTTHKFSVIEHDRRVTILVTAVAGGSAHSIWLKAPGREPVELTAQTIGDGLEISPNGGKWRITIDQSLSPSWAGEWQVVIRKQLADTAFPQVSVWTLSSLHIALQQSELLTAADQAEEASRDFAESLIALKGEDDVRFSKLKITPRLISEKPQPAEETEREIEVSIKPGRLETPGETFSKTLPESSVEKTEEERSREPEALSSVISARLPVPVSNSSATILDLPIKVTGVDSTGQAFQREMRSNVVQLLPSSVMRDASGIGPPLIFTRAEISQVLYENNTVLGVRLKSGKRARNVMVIEPKLREFLARVDLSDRQLHFCVAGNRLLGIIRRAK